MWDNLMSVVDNWYFIGGCLFLLLVLVGILVYRLMFAKKDEE